MKDLSVGDKVLVDGKTPAIIHYREGLSYFVLYIGEDGKPVNGVGNWYPFSRLTPIKGDC